MIRTFQIFYEGKTYPLQYPFSPLMESIVTQIMTKNEYPLLPFLQNHSGAVLDIGANIGCASLLFSVYYPLATIYAFEPSPSSFQFLQSNMKQFPNVHPFNYGLDSKDGSARLYSGQGASVTNSLGTSVLNSSEFETAELRRLSAFILDNDLDRILLIKIDTEGSEVPILKDIEHLLDRVESVMLEYHSEGDRLKIDRLLTNRFMLYSGNAPNPHRGTLIYVSKSTVAAKTNWDAIAIHRPFQF
jgi:FkbM family methyltransferase